MQTQGVIYKKLPNKNFVLQIETCALCGGKIKSVVPAIAPLEDNSHRVCFHVTNDRYRRRICPKCHTYTQTELGDYGFRLVPGKFKTPMDKNNTMILGLEQEFEGYFFGWLELAKIDIMSTSSSSRNHMFHLGYDTSIRVDSADEFTSCETYHNGQNELSWNCGSYSWWKYVSPLGEVCDILNRFGGKEGDSAGMHIHASFYADSDSSVKTDSLARRCFKTLENESVRNLILIVSGRSQERLDRWAFMTKRHPDSPEYRSGPDANYTDHHACISYNRAGTVEFRCFSCSLDKKRILKRMKFVKEFVTMVRDKVKPSEMVERFSIPTRNFIKEEQAKQLEKGNITPEQMIIKE